MSFFVGVKNKKHKPTFILVEKSLYYISTCCDLNLIIFPLFLSVVHLFTLVALCEMAN